MKCCFINEVQSSGAEVKVTSPLPHKLHKDERQVVGALLKRGISPHFQGAIDRCPSTLRLKQVSHPTSNSSIAQGCQTVPPTKSQVCPCFFASRLWERAHRPHCSWWSSNKTVALLTFVFSPSTKEMQTFSDYHTERLLLWRPSSLSRLSILGPILAPALAGSMAGTCGILSTVTLVLSTCGDTHVDRTCAFCGSLPFSLSRNVNCCHIQVLSYISQTYTGQ